MTKFNDPSLLILTVVPNFGIAYAMAERLTFYAILISLSTTASVLYHLDETNKIIKAVDYIIAGIWGLTDLILIPRTLYINAALAAMCGLIEIISKHNFAMYSILHSIWHVLFTIKTLIVATAIVRSIDLFD